MKNSDGELVKEAIVVCPKCGQKNRLYQRARQGLYRCGSCQTILNDPFPRGKASKSIGTIFKRLGRPGIVVLVILGIALLFGNKKPRRPYSPNAPGSASNYTPKTERAPRPVFVRPVTAPNGQLWPGYAAYIPGYPILAKGGRSSITVDNTQNSSDLFVKLVSLNTAPAYPIRFCYVPAHSQFKFEDVTAGLYDVRYRDLSSGVLSKTKEVTLTETRTSNGVEFFHHKFTTYTVRNGNMQVETIDESEF